MVTALLLSAHRVVLLPPFPLPLRPRVLRGDSMLFSVVGCTLVFPLILVLPLIRIHSLLVLLLRVFRSLRLPQPSPLVRRLQPSVVRTTFTSLTRTPLLP